MVCPIENFAKTLKSLRESSNILVSIPPNDISFKSNVAAINLFVTGKELTDMPSSDLISFIYNTEKILKGVETGLVELEVKFDRLVNFYKFGRKRYERQPKVKSEGVSKKKVTLTPTNSTILTNDMEIPLKEEILDNNEKLSIDDSSDSSSSVSSLRSHLKNKKNKK